MDRTDHQESTGGTKGLDHNLVNLQLNEGLQVIGSGAFLWCRALQQVVLPPKLTELRPDKYL